MQTFLGLWVRGLKLLRLSLLEGICEDLYLFCSFFVVAAVVTVRFEDLQFNVKGMIDQVCRCAGAVPREEGKFTYIVDSGKWGPGE